MIEDLTDSIRSSYGLDVIDIKTRLKFLEKGIVLYGFNDSVKEQMKSDFHPVVNYKSENKFNIPIAILCGLLGLVGGIIVVYIIYKVLMYVLYGSKILGMDKYLGFILRKKYEK